MVNTHIVVYRKTSNLSRGLNDKKNGTLTPNTGGAA